MALRRAAHQIADTPLVFPDPLALRILDVRDGDSLPSDLRAPDRPSSKSLRAFLVARSRFAEDALHTAVEQDGVRQYVLLGAGLDTFAYRNPHADLRVFEVDHPATQQWKFSMLHAAGIGIPGTAVHVAIDFRHDALLERLTVSGFDPAQPAVFAWLGVVPYLSHEAFHATLADISACAPGSSLLMDYGLPRAALSTLEQMEFDSLAARVAAAGEPFQTFFLPDELRAILSERRWRVHDDLDRNAMNARYFTDRTDGLRLLRGGAHLLSAVLLGP